MLLVRLCPPVDYSPPQAVTRSSMDVRLLWEGLANGFRETCSAKLHISGTFRPSEPRAPSDIPKGQATKSAAPRLVSNTTHSGKVHDVVEPRIWRSSTIHRPPSCPNKDRSRCLPGRFIPPKTPPHSPRNPHHARRHPSDFGRGQIRVLRERAQRGGSQPGSVLAKPGTRDG